MYTSCSSQGMAGARLCSHAYQIQKLYKLFVARQSPSVQYILCIHNKGMSACAIPLLTCTVSNIRLGLSPPLTQHSITASCVSALCQKVAIDLQTLTKTETCNCPSDYYKDKSSKLGPDPLRQDADPERLWEKMRISKKPVGGILMDQTAVAGIGNIYRAEILFKVCILLLS